MKLFSLSNHASTLWQGLVEAGMVQGEMPVDAATEAAAGDASPWFVKAMLGVAAWLSSLLFLAFIALATGSLFSDAWVRGISGLVACVLSAVVFFRGRRGVFMDQLLFVLVLLGQLLVLSAFLADFERQAVAWWAAAFFEVAMVAAVRYGPSRFLSAVAALGCLYEAMDLSGGAVFFMPMMLALLIGVAFNQWRAPRLLWSVVLALSLTPVLIAVTNELYSPRWYAGDAGESLPFWVSRAGMVLVWLGMVFALLQQVMRSSGQSFLLRCVLPGLLALLLAAGTWPVPLALFSLAVFLLGFAQQSRLLSGVGIAQLLWSVGHYYYALQDTLLFKSLSLSLLGVALLLCYAASAMLWRSGDRQQSAGSA